MFGNAIRATISGRDYYISNIMMVSEQKYINVNKLEYIIYWKLTRKIWWNQTKVDFTCSPMKYRLCVNKGLDIDSL